MNNQILIGDFIKLTGSTLKTVLYYHKIGLLKEPKRSISGYRLYGAEDLEHMRVIKHLKHLGLDLKQIKEISGHTKNYRSLIEVLQSLQAELLIKKRNMVEFNVTAGTIQWIITAYMIVIAILVPVTAFLIQTFKTKQLFLAAMGILLIGTICGACSGSFVMLLISRIIQAAGTGMMIPIMMNTVLIVAPKEKRGSVMGLCGAALTVGPAIGPTVAGNEV